MFKFKCFGVVLLLLLCSNCLPSQADLMDMISEASCAARCFQQFTVTLNGPDKLFLQQRPDLTQPHCINQKGECALCLEICQWPRSQTDNCPQSCKALATPSVGPHSARQDSTCIETCTFSQNLYSRKEQFEQGQLPIHCPRVESWPAVCHPTCQTDADCRPLGGVHKCCHSAACPEAKHTYRSATNRTQHLVCTPGVPSLNVPFVPGQPTVKQVEVVPDHDEGSTNPQAGSTNQYQVELDWLDYYNKSSSLANGWDSSQYPAVFLVQLRLFHDPTGSVNFTIPPDVQSPESSSFTDRLFGEWRNLVWTTKLGAVLSDLTAGTWYQFRLLALSSQGHGGWGQPSRAIRVRTRPEPPHSPRNLTEVKTRIFENSVDVTINWQPPKLGNTPLKKYQVTWRRYYGFHGDDRSSFTEYEANVPADKTMYTIQNLKPATSYKIEVKAVSMFEGKELKSHPISLYLNTIPIPARQVEKGHYSNTNDTCSCGDATQPNISIQPAFYENRKLKAILRIKLESDTQMRRQYMVDWAPRVCIESHSNAGQEDYIPQRLTVHGSELIYVTLDNLRFQCHYKVIVKPINDWAENIPPGEYVACFCTPACQSVPVKSAPPPPNCSITTAVESMQPMRLTYTILSESQTTAGTKQKWNIKTDPELVGKIKTYEAMLNWYPLPTEVDVESRRSFRALNQERTSKHTSTTNVRGVRVTWGPRIYEPVQLESYHNGLIPHLDPENAQSKVVDPRSSTFLLKGLQQETLYIVHVQPIGEHTDGPTSTIFFSIPNKPERSKALTARVNHYLLYIPLFCQAWYFCLSIS